MKKIAWKLVACLTVAMLLCLPVLTGCSKPDKTSEGLLFSTNGDGTCYVSGIGKCTDTDVVIPSTSPEGDSVTSIIRKAFDGCKNLTSITIPDSVTSIDDFAFSDCTNLTSITIGDGVTSIGDGAFDGCTSLTSITIPDSVTSIGPAVFEGCIGLTNITVDSGNLTYHSHDNCLIETESKTLIAGCQNSVIPTDGSVTSIAGRAFFGYTTLANITIPDSVRCIENYAFGNCTNLTSIAIPDDVTSIGVSVFGGCTSLTSITVGSGNYTYHSRNDCLIETRSKMLIAGCQNSVIPDDGSVTDIGNYAFSGCSGLTSITIPDTVTDIGNSAFSGCTDLTSIAIPNSVVSIGQFAFSGTSLTSIIIPDSVKKLGDWAFSGCTSLTSITIPNSVTSIGHNAFHNCASLKSITIPDSVRSIDTWAFSNCSGLVSVTIGNGVTSIGGNAFYDNTSLTDVHYSGTKAQWQAIEIENGNYSLSSATIHCADGDITPEQ